MAKAKLFTNDPFFKRRTYRLVRHRGEWKMKLVEYFGERWGPTHTPLNYVSLHHDARPGQFKRAEMERVALAYGFRLVKEEL